MTEEQLGHLRHFDNLSRQLPNDWSSMQGKGIGQDDFGGYRFQLAYMAYALALTHVHRRGASRRSTSSPTSAGSSIGSRSKPSICSRPG
jgi:hypothetical protein